MSEEESSPLLAVEKTTSIMIHGRVSEICGLILATWGIAGAWSQELGVKWWGDDRQWEKPEGAGAFYDLHYDYDETCT